MRLDCKEHYPNHSEDIRDVEWNSIAPSIVFSFKCVDKGTDYKQIEDNILEGTRTDKRCNWIHRK